MLALPARADQTDPRLPGLFARLGAAKDLVEARAAEATIWEIWGETLDAESAELLAQGSAAMASRAWSTAMQRFDALVAREPNFAEAWNKRATLYYLIGDYPRSVADIQKTLALEPRHFGALSGLGLIFMTIGRPQPALESFEAALAIHPFLPGARQNIEALRQQLGGEEL
jgi:tetratricopeptide (TPR) repeat protein